jgi:hypothetical protein
MMALVFIMERLNDNITEGADPIIRPAKGLTIRQVEDPVIRPAEDRALNPADQEVHHPQVDHPL